MPSPFSPFLEEKVGAEQNLKQLEHERKHMCETVKGMRGRIKLLDKRIAELKKRRQNQILLQKLLEFQGIPLIR